jgi:curved DNA-binding protein CbpA
VTDLYAVLQMAPDAEHDAIRASFRALARRFHPDLGGDAGEMQTVNEAWSILGQPDRRLAYDRDRASRLDHGRYQGWSIEALVEHDPDYVDWFRQTPAGRRWRGRIDRVLAERAARVPPRAAPTKRRHGR